MDSTLSRPSGMRNVFPSASCERLIIEKPREFLNKYKPIGPNYLERFSPIHACNFHRILIQILYQYIEKCIFPRLLAVISLSSIVQNITIKSKEIRLLKKLSKSFSRQIYHELINKK